MKVISFILSFLFFLNISTSAPLRESDKETAEIDKSLEFIKKISEEVGLGGLKMEKREEKQGAIEKRDISLLTDFFKYSMIATLLSLFSSY